MNNALFTSCMHSPILQICTQPSACRNWKCDSLEPAAFLQSWSTLSNDTRVGLLLLYPINSKFICTCSLRYFFSASLIECGDQCWSSVCKYFSAQMSLVSRIQQMLMTTANALSRMRGNAFHEVLLIYLWHFWSHESLSNNFWNSMPHTSSFKNHLRSNLINSRRCHCHVIQRFTRHSNIQQTALTISLFYALLTICIL